MDVLVERCAGLDVHRDDVVATVRVPGPGPPWKAAAAQGAQIVEKHAFARAANMKRSTRSFVLRSIELGGWSKKYDVEQIAREIKPDDWALFLRVIDETKAFAEAVTLAKESGGTPES